MLTVVLFGAGLFGAYYLGIQKSRKGDSPSVSPTPSEAVYCPADVRACPDGSFVGRIPPKCEFIACPTSDETANWKTYKDDVVGVEFKYPEKWYVLRSSKFPFRVFILGKQPSKTFEIDTAGQVAVADMPAIDILSTELADEGRKYTVDKTLEDGMRAANFVFNESTLKKTDLTIGGKKAIQISGEWGPNQDGTYSSWLTLTYIQLDNHLLGVSSNKQAKTEYNQILSTFKFTD